jgi:hypothetical protein
MAKTGKGVGPRRNYYNQILRTQGSSLIGLWRLNELGPGLNAGDWSKQGNNAAFGTATMMAKSFGPDGHRCPLFDGSTSYVNIYSAGLLADATPAEASCLVWVKPAAASVLVDSTERYIFYIYTDANNYAKLSKTTVDNTYALDYVANSTSEQTTSTVSDADWHSLGAVVSDTGDVCKFYVDGVLIGTDTGIGTWSGAIGSTTCVLGASSTSAGSDSWSGYMGIAALWNTALTNAEMLAIGSLKAIGRA